ncbi:MAG TPA: sialidase family protein, partial [Reyranella sp.]|nr:sialidase family protein [Reyranella sp.]
MRLTISALALMALAGSAAAQHHDHGGAMHSFSADARKAFTATPAFGPDGALWVARGTADRVVLARSTDLGKTFTDPVSVTADALNMDWGPDSRPQLAVDKTGAIVVTYAVFQDKRFNGRIYATRSTDGGATFATPVPITSDSTSQRFQAVGIDPDGRMFAAWLDKRNAAAAIAAGKPYPGAALAYAWSDDGGRRFSDTRIAVDNTCECCRLGLAFAGPGRPALMFRNVFEGS